MTSKTSALMRRLLLRKGVDTANDPALRRVLGPVHLVLLGVSCIIGAGVYVMTGAAAANYAGPAVVVSFALAGLACAFTAFC